MRLYFKQLILFLSVVLCVDGHAENLRAFNNQTRSQIEKINQGKAFVLAFWSVDCPYCIEEMQLLGDALRKYPQVKLITVCTDATGRQLDISQALDQAHLPAHERWQFSEIDEDRLRYNIDKSWGGELPRTYFYDTKYQVHAISGRAPIVWLDDWLLKTK
jgi:thiol-disulfide isomerase/thioredoxin